MYKLLLSLVTVWKQRWLCLRCVVDSKHSVYRAEFLFLLLYQLQVTASWKLISPISRFREIKGAHGRYCVSVHLPVQRGLAFPHVLWCSSAAAHEAPRKQRRWQPFLLGPVSNGGSHDLAVLPWRTRPLFLKGCPVDLSNRISSQHFLPCTSSPLLWERCDWFQSLGRSRRLKLVGPWRENREFSSEGGLCLHFNWNQF